MFAVVAATLAALVVAYLLFSVAIGVSRRNREREGRRSDGLPRRLPRHAAPAPAVRRQAGHDRTTPAAAAPARRARATDARRRARRQDRQARAAARPPRPQPLRGRHGEVHRLRAVRGVCPAQCIYVRGADNDPDDPTSPGERFGFVYEINYLRCIHCDLCVEACPTEAITESKLFEFSFTNRQDAIYTKAELLVGDRRQAPAAALGGLARRRGRQHDRVDAGHRRRPVTPTSSARSAGAASSATACRPPNRRKTSPTFGV